jgi:hypothetical protein
MAQNREGGAMSQYLPASAAAELGRVQRWSLLVGIIALAICVLGALFSPDQFFRAYLAAYQFYLGIALGSFVILMIYHLTGGAWGLLIQHILEAAMRTLPYLALLFIPIACGLKSLYLWSQPAEVEANKDLQHKQIYLNEQFFWGRAALFFVLWIVIAFLLDRWSRRQDETGDQRFARWQANLSGPGLIIFGISITFAAVDWLMSLQPKFHSTIYGPLVVTGQVLSGHAVALIALAWLAERSAIAEVLSPKALSDLGNLLFTFLVVWAYMVWFQFMLIWIANLPYEVIWYLPRARGGWEWVGYALLVFHFIIPFFLLLMRDVKQHLPTLAKVAGLLLAMQLVHGYYLVMPSFPDTTLSEHWMDFLTPLGIGGLWLWCFLHELKRRPMLPRQADDRAEAVHLPEVDQEAANQAREIQHG